MGMDVVHVLHMNGGMGDLSYSHNSLIQKKVICMTMPMKVEAITNLYCTTLPAKLVIADLGCSSGPNTFFVVSELIKVVENLCKKLDRKSPEYHIFLNDLPGNDFNNTFKSIECFRETLRNGTSLKNGTSYGPCYLNGTPGSFYGRIFPSKSLHFVHSSYSLHWLSQVPEGIDKDNKGNIYMGSSSPPNVLNAYYVQFQRDFSLFLKCRAEELVEGGRMVLTFLGRKSDCRNSKECCNIWELMASAFNDLVLEGVVEEEQVDSFNIPQYTPSLSEIEVEILKEGSFTIDQLEASQVEWTINQEDINMISSSPAEAEALMNNMDTAAGYNVAKYMRAVAEPMLVAHFGQAIIDEVFKRYQEKVVDCISKEKAYFVNVTVSVTKKYITEG